MAAHACLKNEFTEDEKCHNLMRWLISLTKVVYLELSSAIRFCSVPLKRCRAVQANRLAYKTYIRWLMFYCSDGGCELCISYAWTRQTRGWIDSVFIVFQSFYPLT